MGGERGSLAVRWLTGVCSGGMGLTGGLVDVGNLYDCLYGIYTGQLDDSILDKYSEVRIQKFKEIIDPISSDNIRRLWDPSQEAIDKDPFYQMIIKAGQDEEFGKKMQGVSGPASLRVPFSLRIDRVSG